MISSTRGSVNNKSSVNANHLFANAFRRLLQHACVVAAQLRAHWSLPRIRDEMLVISLAHKAEILDIL